MFSWTSPVQAGVVPSCAAARRPGAPAATIGRMRFLLTALLLATTSLAFADDAASPEPLRDQHRCGWLATHGSDAVLSDRDGDWLLARTGAHPHATTGEWRPAFGAGQSVATADGAVGCACLTVQADPTDHHVVASRAPQARPLAACRGDKSLETPAAVRPSRAAPKTIRARSFSLDAPADWRASVKDDCVALDAPGRRMKGEDYTLQVCGKPATLAQAADELAISPDEHGVWTRVAGMSSPSPAAWMFGPGWEAVTAVQSCGVGDEQGFHAAGGECLMFAASNGRHGVTADTMGFWTEFDRADAILRTLRFSAN